MNWQLQDAKNRFSEVVSRAKSEGPQTITVRGKRTAIVMSAEQYDSIVKPRRSLGAFLLANPDWDDEMVDAVNQRAKKPSWDVAF